MKNISFVGNMILNSLQIHDLLRNFLLNDLIVSPGKPGYPDLAFRRWLMHNGVLVRSETDMPG